VITLYAMRSPNVYKIAIMLEEIGLPYRLEHVRLGAGDHLKPEMLSRNPNGKLPIIEDDEGPDGRPITVFESGAILIYLAEKSGQLMGSDPRSRLEVLQWLMIQVSGIGPMFGQHVHFTTYAAQVGNEYALERYRSQVYRQLDVLQARLAQRPFIAGPDYSIVDIATFPFIRSILRYGVTFGDRGYLTRWFESVAGRPAVERAIAALSEIDAQDAATFRSLDQDSLDRLVDRGRYART
jgi:GST-like protein